MKTLHTLVFSMPDFYIRSPETNDANDPNRQVFDHFFAMDVTRR